VKTLVLVRHGQYDQATGKLTPLGRRQALASAAALKGVHFDAIHCSTLPRARETAELMKRALRSRSPIQASTLLRERIPTPVPGLTQRRDLPKVRKSFQLMTRAHARLMRPSRGERTELVVAHGNLIRFFVCLALGIAPSKWLKMRIYNCSITTLFVKAEYGEALGSFDEVSHLPHALRTLV
jgi:serine/threonine-protein phosphatase PGAM5